MRLIKEQVLIEIQPNTNIIKITQTYYLLHWAERYFVSQTFLICDSPDWLLYFSSWLLEFFEALHRSHCSDERILCRIVSVWCWFFFLWLECSSKLEGDRRLLVLFLQIFISISAILFFLLGAEREGFAEFARGLRQECFHWCYTDLWRFFSKQQLGFSVLWGLYFGFIF